MRKSYYTVLFTIAALVSLTLAGCATTQTTMRTVQNFEIPTKKLDPGSAFNACSSILIERGYDLKLSSKDSGVLTTEYKKYYSAAGNPPFDYFMQIRVSIKQAANGQAIIRLTPIIKEQNRSNAAAFSESELYYVEGKEGGPAMITFMNVVSDIAEKAGVSNEQIIRNISTETKESKPAFLQVLDALGKE